MRDRRRGQNAVGHRYVSRISNYHPNIKTRYGYRFSYCGCLKIYSLLERLNVRTKTVIKTERRNTRWKSYDF